MKTKSQFTREDALNLLDNVQPHGEGHKYYADEASAWFSFSEEDLGELVELMNSSDEEIATSAYSHWCASYGEEIKNVATYQIQFSHFTQEECLDPGDQYSEKLGNLGDYLPGYDQQYYLETTPPNYFTTREDAEKWLKENHKGADPYGIDAEFEITESSNA